MKDKQETVIAQMLTIKCIIADQPCLQHVKIVVYKYQNIYRSTQINVLYIIWYHSPNLENTKKIQKILNTQTKKTGWSLKPNHQICEVPKNIYRFLGIHFLPKK